MPRKNVAGTFQLFAHRWSKMIDGVRNHVNCKKLGLPRDQWTKEKSQAAANAYFTQLIEQLRHPRADGLRAGVDHLKLRAEFARFVNQPDLAHIRDQQAELIESLIGVESDEILAEHVKMVTAPPDEMKMMAVMVAHKPTQTNQLIDTKLQHFLKVERIRIEPVSYRELERYLRSLQSTPIFPKSMTVSEIVEATVSLHFTWLSEQDWKPEGKNKRVGFFRKFVNWLFTEGHLVNLPKNIRSKRHRFKAEKKAIREFKDVAKVVNALPSEGKHNFRLWALLALNCSVTQSDLGSTTWWDQATGVGVNLENRTLTRFRGKTKKHPKAPIVVYKLWPETVKELEKIKTRQGLLFTVEGGKPLYETWYDENGKAKKKDMVTTYWNRIEPKPLISFGKFRSIGSAQLKKSHLFRQYREVWLADVPLAVADTNYSPEYWKTVTHAMTASSCGDASG